MICSKCGIVIEIKEYTDLYRIEEHHLHPSFMDNPKGLGKRIPLCRDCHIEKLHPLIFEIIKKHSNLLCGRNQSAYWVWKYHVLGENKKKCLEEVITFTEGWLNGNTNS
jgi:hypothetical protein